ncbi:MAG: ATP-binding protein [Anaerolineae bacterium]|nr:ATP-binding protein [Anaerolineae bacterium]
MPNECDLEVLGRADQLDKIREWVGQAARLAGLDDDQVFRVQMSVDEACANVVEHAYEGIDGGEIVLKCAWNAETLTITIQDCGRPFDPTAVPAPNLSSDLQARKPRGLGLYFMYQMMDQVHFEFGQDGCNKLVLVKNIAPSPQNKP